MMTDLRENIKSGWITNAATQTVCSTLSDAGFQVFFVGGCVRNALLGAQVNDIDLSTDAHPDVVMMLAHKAGLKAIPTGIDHGTVTVISNHIPHEITTFRRDIETDGRHAVVAFSTDITEDAQRRDFTMNALYAAPDGTIVDPLGGIRDLKSRYVRFIEDPDKRIQEDYLRILRFFRFHAWYGDPNGGIDPDGLAAIAENLAGLDTLSPERVGSEIKKLLLAPDPAPAVAMMRATGVLPRIFPGCSDRGFGPLVHLEAENSVMPNAMRRLAVLGVGQGVENLRLSRAESAELIMFQAGIESSLPAHALGYQSGFEAARGVLLLRSALFEMPLDLQDLKNAKLGDSAVFPIKAADLMPDITGAALGKKLKELEVKWIASEFTLTREQLLGA